jgi:hypothetical protein
MKDGWIVKTKSGVIREGDKSWSEIDMGSVIGLSMFCKGHLYSVPDNMKSYIQCKGCSANLDGSDVQILSRCIGYEENSKRYLLRVDVKTGDCDLEVSPV